MDRTIESKRVSEHKVVSVSQHCNSCKVTNEKSRLAAASPLRIKAYSDPSGCFRRYRSASRFEKRSPRSSRLVGSRPVEGDNPFSYPRLRRTGPANPLRGPVRPRLEGTPISTSQRACKHRQPTGSGYRSLLASGLTTPLGPPMSAVDLEDRSGFARYRPA